METQNTEKIKKKFGVGRFILGLILLFVLAIWFLVILSDGTNNTYTPHIPIQKQDEVLDDIDAYIEAKDYIEMFLKAPATAIFPPLGQVNRLDNNRYEVISYVDSQNSFGAMLRSGWEVIFQYQNGRKYLEKMVFDGEVVYDPVEAKVKAKKAAQDKAELDTQIKATQKQIDDELEKLKSWGY